jgi:oxaloacetate decarboxylase alpha subunit
MNENLPQQPLLLTDVVLRDAHQSLLATRLRIDDMLPILPKLDQVGFWSVESWGGATFDACIRYLGEDPWERLRRIRAAMPNTRQQMLLRGQNLLGYRHYADDVVRAFVERAAENGVDVFRIFDAMNDVRNMETAIAATIDCGRHAQGTISYTVSPVHTIDGYVEQARRLAELGCDSICIKDMAGLLTPYKAFELVTRLKEAVSLPIAMQSHATTGMSTATNVKAAEAGIDMVDSAISSMSMTYGHSATESLVAIFQGTARDTGLDLSLLEEIAAYFREVRKRYARFEGSLRGVDSRILVAQVPGGMLTNMENQLREQAASDRLDEVLREIPRVRQDLGYIPLVTPTSQIVGTQAVINVMAGTRYGTIARETAAVLRGEYGATPAPVDPELQARVLGEGEQAISCRPADLIEPELERLGRELREQATARGIALSEPFLEDLLIYAQFPQVGLKYLEHRADPSAFEPAPGTEPPPAVSATTGEAVDKVAHYQVTVDGHAYQVSVGPGDATMIAAADAPAAPVTQPVAEVRGQRVRAPMTGQILRVVVREGQQVAEGELLLLLEAMKMETELRAPVSGRVTAIMVREGDAIQVGQDLLVIG